MRKKWRNKHVEKEFSQWSQVGKVRAQLLDDCCSFVPDVSDALIGQQMFCLLLFSKPWHSGCHPFTRFSALRHVGIGWNLPLPPYRCSCFDVEDTRAWRERLKVCVLVRVNAPTWPWFERTGQEVATCTDILQHDEADVLSIYAKTRTDAHTAPACVVLPALFLHNVNCNIPLTQLISVRWSRTELWWSRSYYLSVSACAE